LLGPLAVRGIAADEARLEVIDLAVHPAEAPVPGRAGAFAASRQASAAELRRGGVVGVAVPLFAPGRTALPEEMPLESTFFAMDAWLARSESFRPPGCGSASGRIRTWLTLDGSGELAADPSRIGRWTARGVRIFGLVADGNDELGTAWTSHAPAPQVGLTRAGRALAAAIYDHGGLVDIAGGSDATRADVLELSAARHLPVVALSVAARARTGEPRNLTDAQIRAVGASGGVVGIGFDEHWLVRGRFPELRDVVAHIRHVASVAGIDHVAIASGYGNGIRAPDGLEDASRFPDLAKALLASGLDREDVERIFSRNALRLLCPATGPRRSQSETAHRWRQE
jgi:membrane dipeptidase